jgi:hypothetical protein
LFEGLAAFRVVLLSSSAVAAAGHGKQAPFGRTIGLFNGARVKILTRI